MCRYTPACKELTVIFPESQRVEGYITTKLLNMSRCIADTNLPWIIILC